MHADDYIRLIGSTAGQSVRLDPDTYASPESEAVARLAAGATLVAVDAGTSLVSRTCHPDSRARQRASSWQQA